ncbi:MAG: penicillin-binding transpeptidase domain-containing protein [Oscillospiraceae bacterium]|nr:penicillin-binding transpeptidase domain-containing protein [Oscillospiraceae bacterium]
MDRVTRRRFRGLWICVFLLVGVFTLQLLRLQSQGGEKTGATGRAATTYYMTIPAARGDLLDRNGTPLVEERTCYDVDLINFVFLSNGEPNEKIRNLLTLCDNLGAEAVDHLPVTRERPYAYTLEELNAAWRGYWNSYLENKGWDREMSAKNLIRRMREAYRIPEDWDDVTVRRVLGVRYELDLRFSEGLDHYALVHDADAETLAAILALRDPGIAVSAGTVREYKTRYAAHVLGQVGLMNAAEWEEYQKQDYAMNARVGKDGAEKAFERYLHGSDGTRYVTVASDGTVLETHDTKAPVPGQNVVLTIDLPMQIAAEDALARVVEDLRENGVGGRKEGRDAVGGAVVAISCKTGEVLACASYPTYDPATFTEHFKALSEDENSPLYNRALLAPYFPGSIYKPVTAIAAVDENGTGRWRYIVDRGVYRYYEKQGYTCNCYIYTATGATHGTINMMEAISESCNYYFYEIGRETGIEKIDKVAAGLGLGGKSGAELPESAGTRANPETKRQLYSGVDGDWYHADTLQAAIGQSDNRFTPIQLAQYCATLANGGDRYRATFLHEVVKRDGSGRTYRQYPELLSSYPISSEAQAAYREGMRMAATRGTAATYLHNYPVPVAAKTGTAQHGSGGSDHASFLCYAPFDDPEIAIAVYVEKGAQGGNLGQIARAVLDCYFAKSAALPVETVENTLH